MKPKSTGYRDKRGNPIHYGDTVTRTVGAPWDEQVPLTLHFVIKRNNGGVWMEGVESNFEDDFLKEHAKNCEITRRAKPGVDTQTNRGLKGPVPLQHADAIPERGGADL